MTGERAEMEPDDIEREMFKIAREFMDASKLKKIPSHSHNPNDSHMEVQSRRHKEKVRAEFQAYSRSTSAQHPARWK